MSVSVWVCYGVGGDPAASVRATVARITELAVALGARLVADEDMPVNGERILSFDGFGSPKAARRFARQARGLSPAVYADSDETAGEAK